MSTLENHQIKGITVKNIIVTIVSTSSIVVSVMTTYFGLKAEIQTFNADRITETRVTNLRLSILENEVSLLQKELNAIRYTDEHSNNVTKATSPNSHHFITVLK